jgi:O-antigen/teichoic acid export membrane protein
MNTIVSPDSLSDGANSKAQEAVRKQIRGSGLLVAGRALSVFVTGLTQILIVRHLSTTDYGAWAYALSVVLLWQTLSSFGFQEAVPRFLAIYHENRDHARLLGTMLLSVGIIVLSGVAVITVFFLAPNALLAVARDHREPLTVLAVLIFMVPVEALDAVLIGFFATLANPKAIFFRRHILAPGLRLAVVVMLIMLKAGVVFLAYGYLAASVVGVLIYAGIFLRHLRKLGILGAARTEGIRMPWREVLSFVLPMMTSDLMPILNDSVVVLLLGHYASLRDVAFFRVVIPVAALNHIVGLTAGLLYMPQASRFVATGDHRGLADLYWRTATWVAVLTFPIFIVTFAFAQPLTTILYGARYADAALILAIVAAGYYFEVIWGFNSMTLKAMNKKAFVVSCNLLAAALNISAALILIPRYGALGAAIATAATMGAIAMFRQTAIRAAGVRIFNGNFMTFYLAIAAAAVPLLVVHKIAGTHVYLGAGLALASMLFVLVASRGQLQIREMFPESARLPLVRKLLRSAA